MVKKKTLIDLLGLACKLGYLLFVQEKKKRENQLIEGLCCAKPCTLQQKIKCRKTVNMAKALKTAMLLVEGGLLG